jgi:hypothetical protein
VLPLFDRAQSLVVTCLDRGAAIAAGHPASARPRTGRSSGPGDQGDQGQRLEHRGRIARNGRRRGGRRLGSSWSGTMVPAQRIGHARRSYRRPAAGSARLPVTGNALDVLVDGADALP